MASIVGRGMLAPGCWAFVGVLSGVQILGSLWCSCSHCRDHPVGHMHPRRIEAGPTPGFFESPLSLGEAPATCP